MPRRADGSATQCRSVLRVQRLDLVKRAAHAPAAAVHHMRVDHRGGHIAVAQQFLHRANVVARLQHVRGKGVTQHMR